MAKTIDTPTSRENIATLTTQIAALPSKTVGELAALFEELSGAPINTRNKQFLVRRVAFLLQEKALGGLSDASKVRISELGDALPLDWRARLRAPAPAEETDPRLPPVGGEPLKRRFKGVDHTVTVLADGFEYNGRTFKTLTEVVRAITGKHRSGYAFFGLKK
jgi:hypothetical protein